MPGFTGGRGATVAFRDLDLDVEAGTVLALLGPNGAGKTTLLLTLAGLLPAHDGTVAVDGAPLRNGRPGRRQPRRRRAGARRPLPVHHPDGRGEPRAWPRNRAARRPATCIDVFPALEKRWKLPAGALSGGEQQMLAMARALIQQPKVLLVDEMSMGLAPIVVESLFDTVRTIASDHGAAVVLVEQHVSLALGVADEAAVLNRGAIVLRGRADELGARRRTARTCVLRRGGARRRIRQAGRVAETEAGQHYGSGSPDTPRSPGDDEPRQASGD